MDMWNCRDTKSGHIGQLLLQQLTSMGSQFQGAGCFQLRGKLEKGGESAFWISSLGNAAVLRVLAFEKNPLGLKEPDIASSIRGGTAILK